MTSDLPTSPVDPAATAPRTGDQRRRRALWTAAVVVAVGLTAAACSSTAAPSAAPPAPGHDRHAARGIHGTVQAENGSTWTVANKAGKQFTVTLNQGTAFGTKASPGTAGQFPVGSPVHVAGTVSGTSVTATRITAPRNPGSTPTAPPAPAPA